MQAYDNRLMTIQLTIEGQTITYDQEYYMVATGTRYSGSNFGECTLQLDNIAKSDRDFIIAKTTLWSLKQSLVQVVVNVGRESYGTFQLFQGTVVSANITQPPDIGLILNCANGAANLGRAGGFSATPQANFKTICQQVADNITAANPNSPPTTLDFQSTQGAKSINNYNFSGPVTNQLNKLEQLANVAVWIDPSNGALKVRDTGVPDNTPPIAINSQTGLVGVPQITDTGISLKFLMSNDVSLYSPVIVTSTANALANGNFFVNKSQFEVASRDTPFYWVLDLRPVVLGAPPTQSSQ